MSLKHYLMFSVFKIGPKACLKAKNAMNATANNCKISVETDRQN